MESIKQVSTDIELKNRISRFGERLIEYITKNNIDFLIPIESKGALLVDVACGHENLPSITNVIYHKALRYIPRSKISESNILLVDDIFHSGKHLRNIYEQVIKYGANAKNMHVMAFLDFSKGEKDRDYDGEMHDEIMKNYIVGTSVSRKKALTYLQNEVLEKSMPSVYDHLTIESKHVSLDKHAEFLRLFSLKGRLLHYGKRGGYHTSSIILDDVFPGAWDVPPKIRVWYHPKQKVLRITPVGFPAKDNEYYNENPICRNLKAQIVDSVISNFGEDIAEADYETKALDARLHQLISMKSTFEKAGMDFTFETNHHDRYYPNLSIAMELQQSFSQAESKELTKRSIKFEDVNYFSAVNDVLHLNRAVWEHQKSPKPKDRENKGYTAAEIIAKLPNQSLESLHAAIDYCFDFHYLAAFRRLDSDGISRAYRTTEISDGMLSEEIFGAAVIYSRRKKTPDWFLNKVFPIVSSVNPDIDFGGHLVTAKAYFGDVTRIKHSDDCFSSWKDVQTDLWEQTSSGEGVVYHHSEDPKILNSIKEILDDSRLHGIRETISTVIFLLENGGRNAAILLDILTPRGGGTEFIAYNLTRILTAGIKKPSDETKRQIILHSKGADEKLDLLLQLYEKGDNLLDNLKRKCTRLQQQYLMQIQAEKIVEQAKPFKSSLLYSAMKKVKSGISGSVIAAHKNNFHGFEEAFRQIGIYKVEQKQNLRNVLSKNSHYIFNKLNALGGHTNPWSFYSKYVLKNRGFRFILGYDLTSERRDATDTGDAQAILDEHLHKLIANWIVAFNGNLSSFEMNAGDLRFGFFNNFSDAIGAASWLLHHLDQLNHSGTLPIDSRAISIVLTSGSYQIDANGNTSGVTLDYCGHWLKGKITVLEDLDAASAMVGRKRNALEESQLWILEHSSFEIDRSERKMIGQPKYLEHENKQLKVSPLTVEDYLNDNPYPWH